MAVKSHVNIIKLAVIPRIVNDAKVIVKIKFCGKRYYIQENKISIIQ